MHKEEIDARFRTIFMLWASLLSGVTIFTVVVVALTTGRLGNWTPSLHPDLVLKALAIPVLLMAGGIAFRRRELDLTGEESVVLQRYQMQVLVAGAMQEGGGVLGLILCLLGGMPSWAIAVWGMTAIAMNMTRPQRSELDRIHR